MNNQSLLESVPPSPPPVAVVTTEVESVPPSPPVQPPPASGVTLTQIVLAALGVLAALYFGRPVLLPVVLACIASVTLKPLVTGLSRNYLPTPVSAAIVVTFLVAVIGFAFFELGRPAARWLNEAPERIPELRQRVEKVMPHIGRFNEVTNVVLDLGASLEKSDTAKAIASPVAVKVSDGGSSILNWTGTLIVGIGETLVLLYLLLASGDLFAQKLVHVMPTWRDKKRAVEINHEIQHSISNYLLTVTLINLGLGIVAAGGFYFLGVPNAPMWGMGVAILNYIPYLGPIAGVVLLTAAGLLAFDTLPQGLLPPGWYLLLHLLEANFITPILLGRRFTLNPVVIFVSIIFWTWLWGIPGALLAVPILVSLKVVCDRVPKLSPVGELLAS